MKAKTYWCVCRGDGEIIRHANGTIFLRTSRDGARADVETVKGHKYEDFDSRVPIKYDLHVRRCRVLLLPDKRRGAK